MSPIYAVYRAGLASRRVKSARILEDGEHLLEHNGLKVPVSVQGHRVSFHLDQAAGTLGNGFVHAFRDGLSLTDRGHVSEVAVNMLPHSEKASSTFVIYGDSKPDLCIERHDRETKNFQASSNKERE